MALIDEQDAIPVVIDRWEINAVGLEEEILCEMCENPMHTDRGCDGLCSYDKDLYKRIIKVLNDRMKPLQPDVPVINVGDMISRREAIKAICEDGTWLERQGCTEITMAERKQRDADIIDKLPSVQPKCGHWMIEPTEEPEYCKCSECGYVNLIVEVFSLDGYRYCPNCGAKMERNEDGTDL